MQEERVVAAHVAVAHHAVEDADQLGPLGAEVVENLPMREAITEATVRVREGASISKSLAASKLFPPMMIHLISSGEAGGRLEEMLSRAAAGISLPATQGVLP